MISGDIQNKYGKWIVVIALTTEDIDNIEPFEVFVKNTSETGIDYPSKIQFIYPFTVDRERLKKCLGKASRKVIEQSKQAWKTAFEVEEW